MNFGAILLLFSCLSSALIDFALPKWKADKNVQIEDAYKWTYQATRGGEHAVPDPESARGWLESEWSSLGAPTTGEAVWEPLCPGGDIGRINLRPFRSKGGRQDDLLEAFLASSQEFRSDGTNFVAAWNELGTRLRRSAAGNLSLDSWTKLDGETRPKNYPAIHHSEAYEEAMHPAYRIVTSSEKVKLMSVLK